MAYGPPTTGPIADGYVPPSPYNPGANAPLPDASLPTMVDLTTERLGKRGTLAKGLPALPASEIGDLSFTNYKQIEAAEKAYAQAVGSADRKSNERYNRRVASAKDDQAQKYAERTSKNYNSRKAYKGSKYGDARERNAALRIAQGIGALDVMFSIR